MNEVMPLTDHTEDIRTFCLSVAKRGKTEVW